MTEIGYNKSYEDNDYLFLFEFKIKEIKWNMYLHLEVHN
jgi:hypothetical protein